MSSSTSPSSSPSPPVGTLSPPPSNSTPSTPSPPLAISPPPPTVADSPPPSSTTSPPPSASIPPPPATTSPPPAAAPPPAVTSSPPQPLLAPPPATPPPATLAPPPLIASPPPTSSPPVNSTQTPPPPSTDAAPPPLISPPTNSPPPPPSITPPNIAPPPPVSPSPTTAPAPKEAASPLAPPAANTSDGSTPTPTTPTPKTNQTISPASVINPGESSSSGNGNSNSGTVIAIAVVVAFIAVSLVGLTIWLLRKRRNKSAGYDTGFAISDSSPFQSSLMSGSSHGKSTLPPPPSLYKSASGASEAGLSGSRSGFSYEEMYDITDGFSPQNVLGEGGFGCVYKGVFQDGRPVAVKQLKDGSGQGEREFQAEVEIISRIHHRHLVSLVGYCISEEHRLLVYDYVPNGTLESHLHGKGIPALPWAIRVKVAVGSARGLAYLHEDCHPRIIHRDIKSSNILLDNNFEAQVADFGLARLAMDTNTHVTTRVMGTFGYLAPEYASSGKLTEKSDVYSFGVVLLELITGKKPVDGSRPLGDESLVEWARPMLAHALESGDFGELPDPRLEGNYNEAEMFRMIEAAAACVRHSAGMRPRMSKVVRVFDGLVDNDLNNGVAPGQSGAFHVAQSADIRLFQRMAFGSQEFSSDYSRSNWSRQSDTKTG